MTCVDKWKVEFDVGTDEQPNWETIEPIAFEFTKETERVGHWYVRLPRWLGWVLDVLGRRR